MGVEYENLKKEIIEEALKNKGSLELDFAKQAHYDYYRGYLLELSKNKYGDEDKEKNIQNLLTYLVQVRKQAVMVQEYAKKKSPSEAQMTGTENDDDYADYHEGPDDVCYIEQIQTRTEEQKLKLATNITGSFVDTKKIVKVTGTIFDDSGEQIGSIQPETYHDIKDFEQNMNGELAKLVGKEKKNITAQATITSVAKKKMLQDKSNGLECPRIRVSVNASNTLELVGIEDMITRFAVLDPIIKAEHRLAPDHKEIKISYSRQAQVPDYDYTIENYKITDTEILVKMPAAFCVEVDEGYQIQGISEEDGVRMYLESGVGGKFYNFSVEDVETSFYSIDGKIKRGCKLTFPEDWRTKFIMKQGDINAVIRFYAQIYISVYDEEMDEVIPFSVCAKSRKDDEIDFTPDDGKDIVKQIPKIYMQWGCIGKDTLVMMADKTEKKVCEIQIGDSVLSEDGKAMEVKNIYYGYEKAIMAIYTEAGSKILLTPTHTIRIVDKWVMAKNVRIGDYVQQIEGWVRVNKIEEVCYNDKVYNLKFEEETPLYGNGILVGDFDMQQTRGKEASYEAHIVEEKESDEMEKVLEELYNL